MTREGFRSRYADVYGQAIPDSTARLLLQAEAVRDRIMHGKLANDDDKRNAIAHGLKYADELNDFTAARRGPKPFGDLRGFKGARQSLDVATTRWLLKGIGFPV
jgi:hypothetical protein